MQQTLCVTGSEGAIGRPLVTALEAAGYVVRRFDIAIPPGEAGHGDVRDQETVRDAVAGCAGVVHLAAVSRVVWGENDPEACWAVNVVGTEHVMNAARAAASHPWVVLASSREVYGTQETLPVREDAPKRPVNLYGRTKLAAEAVADNARSHGLSVAILRLSNVYGSLHDHPDRVAPAFCRAAATGGTMEVYGPDSTCDFTHIDDTVAAFLASVSELSSGRRLDSPMNIATGEGTTLLQLAQLANEVGGGRARVIVRQPKHFAVDHFVGDPGLARRRIAWRARTPLRAGIHALVLAWQGRNGPT